MRRALLAPAAAVLLLGPTALAFFAGGFFEGPRLTAAVVAWALVLVVACGGSLAAAGEPRRAAPRSPGSCC